MVTKKENITPKECVQTVIIEMEERKNLGNATIKNFMHKDIVKIVISTFIIM